MRKALLSALCILLSFMSYGHDVVANEVFGYSLMSAVISGKGKITENGTVKERDLLMDVYLATAPS